MSANTKKKAELSLLFAVLNAGDREVVAPGLMSLVACLASWWLPPLFSAAATKTLLANWAESGGTLLLHKDSLIKYLLQSSAPMPETIHSDQAQALTPESDVPNQFSGSCHRSRKCEADYTEA